MNTEQTNSFVVNNGHNGNNTNIMQYFDQIIALRMIKTTDQLSKNFSLKNLFLIVLLLGADFVKKELNNVLSNLYKYAKNKIITFDIKRFYHYLQSNVIKQSNKFELIEIPTGVKLNSIDTVLLYNNSFKECIFNYLMDKTSKVQYQSENILISQISKNEYGRKIKYRNISIKYNSIEIKINNEILFNTSVVNNFVKYKSADIENTKSTHDSIVNFESTGFFNNILCMLPISLKSFAESLARDLRTKGRQFPKCDHPMIAFLCKELNKKYNIQSIDRITEIMIIELFNLGCNSSGDINFNFIIDNNKICDIEYSKEEIEFLTIPLILDNYNDSKSYTCINDINMKNIVDLDKYLIWFNNIFKIKESIIESKMHFTISSKDNSINLYEEWLNFTQSLNTEKTLKTIVKQDISIYDININKNKKIIKEYKPKQIIKKKNDNDDLEEIIIDAIEEEFEIISEVACKHINSIYKDFSTLYLKEHDHHVLSTILNNFKNKHDIYKELGLPYKFGLLLHGIPGTGKSSSISAIASFLQKDIYYVDFTNIKSNNDLKLVFNTVNKQMTNGGIIVMEDIDVMTNIVHHRHLHEENKDLTLECFLNLLQGSLTNDGSIFIATTNNIDILDKAFIRDGRFDVKIKLEECDYYQMNHIYNKFFNREIPESLIKKIPEMSLTPAKFISKILPYVLTDVDDNIIVDNIINN